MSKKRRLSENYKYTLRASPCINEPAKDLADTMNRWLSEFGNELVKSCSNCKFMRRVGPAYCEKYCAVPPIDVIVAGCAAHDDIHPSANYDDEIPF